MFISVPFLATLLISAASLGLGKVKIVPKTTCQTYYPINSTYTSCDDGYYACSRKHQQCTGAVVARKCYQLTEKTDFLGYPIDKSARGPPKDKVTCTVSYGRNTAQAKGCNTEKEKYSCEGGSVADKVRTCYNCQQVIGV